MRSEALRCDSEEGLLLKPFNPIVEMKELGKAFSKIQSSVREKSEKNFDAIQ
jgi:hypothetical protein